ncbi:fimbrial protein StdA [Salmonella enterica]|nr:fimbrial protein StdA [Salmonella enterica]EFT9441167.1 fimbrial protein StdA [Salmonella enterica]EFV1301460.1 fimbrial protein StdA [Salmonella enterica]
MRNKILLAMSVAGMMCSATAFADAATATATASGKITAIGTITNAPCDIKPGDEDLIVNFNQVSNKKLKAQNTADATNVRHVSIHLANCSFEAGQGNQPDLLSKVTMTFSGNQSTDNKYFTNSTASGMAQNVGLLLRKTNGDDIPPSTGIADLQLTAGDNNTINFDALLVNTGTENSVTTGEINIPVTYTLTYQ